MRIKPKTIRLKIKYLYIKLHKYNTKSKTLCLKTQYDEACIFVKVFKISQYFKNKYFLLPTGKNKLNFFVFIVCITLFRFIYNNK